MRTILSDSSVLAEQIACETGGDELEERELEGGKSDAAERQRIRGLLGELTHCLDQFTARPSASNEQLERDSSSENFERKGAA